MRRGPGRTAGTPGAIEILDAAIHLLRIGAAGALVPFYAGSVPFVLGFLFFWLDMGRSSFARRHVAEGSLLLALLYIWMKVWQAVFARLLRARLSGRAGARLSPSAWARHLLAQAALQPTSLFVLPLASLVLLPYGWVYAYYQSLAVTGDSAAARRQASLWPRQNHVIILILLPLGLFAFLNLAATIFLVPFILKTLFGVETAFSRSPLTLLNTTFFLTACGLTYLAVAPVAKAAYVVRCFHGDSLTTGEDLRVELRGLSTLTRRAAAMVLAVLLLGTGTGTRVVWAETAKGARAAHSSCLPPDEIDRAIREVARRSEFAWRLPQAPAPDDEKGLMARFFEGVADTTTKAVRPFSRWIGRLAERLLRLFRDRVRSDRTESEGMGWVTSIQGLLAILLALVACAAALFFWRSRGKSVSPGVTKTVAVPAIPDVSVEESAAADVPAESWLERARELARRGDRRQAVRALHLACLSHLASRDLLTLARFKSNRDYQIELRRRGRERPGLGPLFADDIAIFEQVWYGRHEATDETLRLVTSNFERLRAHA